MFQLTHQKQMYADNCGPTCVAIVADTTQFTAIRKMFHHDRKKWCHSWYPDICRGLDALEVEHGRPDKPVKRWSKIPSIAIVSVDDDDHWVVFSPREGKRGIVYDPLKKRPVEIGQYTKKPCSYMTVKPRQ